MKKNLLYLLVALVFSSCATIQRATYPYFTSVEKMTMLKKGMEIQKVNSILGIDPYDLYVTQEEGVTVALYHYRTKKRRMKLSGNFTKADEQKHGSSDGQTAGKDWYDKDEKKVFVLFEDGKMLSLLTDKGRADGEVLLMVNNNLKYITKKEFQSVQMDPSKNWVVISDRGDRSNKKGKVSSSTSTGGLKLNSKGKPKVKGHYSKEEWKALTKEEQKKVNKRTWGTLAKVYVVLVAGVLFVLAAAG